MMCGRCGFQSEISFQACPNCLDPVQVLGVEDLDPNAPVRLSAIEARPVGGCITDTPFDIISDHGIPYGAAILIAGPAGCGKSSWALIIGTRWGQRTGHAWYLPYEQGIEQLRRDADRLKVKSEYLWVVGSESSPLSFYASRGLVIIDSLNHFATHEGMSLPDSVAMLRSHATAHHTTVLMLSHVTKEWEIAGPEKVKHEADVVIEIVPGIGRSASKRQPLQAIRCMEKNRFGSLWQRLSVEPWNHRS